jgi:hypothetical protein
MNNGPINLDALQAEVDALKRLQAETAADPPSSDFGATWLDALLPAILPSSRGYDATGDHGFKGEFRQNYPPSLRHLPDELVRARN